MNEKCIEPLDFKHDEVIEVSNNRKSWGKRHFKEKIDGEFHCYANGKSSLSIEHENEYAGWRYARKLNKTLLESEEIK